jgi:spore germination cell wall hydrolase CwlJ-like protein
LSIEFPARVNTRALGGAVLTGAGLSLVLVASYLAGGAAKTALAKTHGAHVASVAFAAPQASAVRPQLTPTPAALRLPLAQPETSVEAPVVRGRGALDCLTDAVYYEARGESDRGQAAVAQVVLNRVRRPGFPKSVCGVVFQGAAEHACQFSFVCDGAMAQGREPAAWRRARVIAQRALDGAVMEDVGDATNFHVARLGQIWGSGLVKVAQVGAHVFYKLTGHGGFAPHPADTHPDTHPDRQPDNATAVPADGGGDQPSLILASAVTVKTPLGEGGPAGPPPEPASAPAAPTPAKAPPPVKPPAPTAKAAASPVAPVATAAKADG